MAKAAARRGGLRGYFSRANLYTSAVLVFPLFLLYQLAVLLLPDVGNGADLITGRLYALFGASRSRYLLFDLALLVGFLACLSLLRRKQQFDVRLFVPVIVESGFYALTMGALIVHVMRLIGIDPRLSLVAEGRDLLRAATAATTGGPLTRVALSLGAGVNEELAFRLMLLTALAWLLEKVLGLRRFSSVLLAFVVSSLVFSAAHHVIGGEPWRLQPFVFRFFCGMIFATLFWFRGFGVAVYTHALYDIYVMLFA